jgi:hypothetical protein
LQRYEINLLVTADLAAFFKLWGGRISYYEAINTGVVRVEGIPSFVRAFPQWFGWDALDAFEKQYACAAKHRR